MIKMEKIGVGVWEVPIGSYPGMRVPARILSSDKLIGGIDDNVIRQITNVATLPGIEKYAICMPDAHLGYGFPIGGVAAFDAREGIISPGGIGFDINCGVRLLKTDLMLDDIKPFIKRLVGRMFSSIPSGVGKAGIVSLNKGQFKNLMINGSSWCLANGYATDDDLVYTESQGRIEGADPTSVSEKAFDRGLSQLGTLGSGNHYLEIEFIGPRGLINPELGAAFGLRDENQVVIAIHCGSRGFGHQIATDYLRLFNQNSGSYDFKINDRQLTAAPINSPDGEAYYGAMACAANCAFANRQVIAWQVTKVFERVMGKSAMQMGFKTIYDVAHNIARFETYKIDGRDKKVLVHRKGATRSFGPGHKELPASLQKTGQPVIVGGSMESGSALFVGTNLAEKDYFGSTVHGAGRVMSRSQAKKRIKGDDLMRQMARRGIMVKTGHMRGLAEEAGFAYKDLDEVSQAVDNLGLSRLVAKFSPIANIKG